MKKYKPVTPPDGLPQSDKAGVEGKSWLDDFAERLGPTTFIVTHPRPEEPAIKPYPGFTQAESEVVFEETLAKLQDFAKNSESKDIRKEARRILRKNGLPLKGTIWNPGNYNPPTYSPPDNIT